MLDGLKDRIHQIETLADRAFPNAAVRIADEIRGKVKASKRGAQKRRKLAREALKISGLSAKEIKARVRMPKRKTSGISINGFVDGDKLIVRASETVQLIGRRNDEPKDWTRILSEQVHFMGRPV